MSVLYEFRTLVNTMTLKGLTWSKRLSFNLEDLFRNYKGNVGIKVCSRENSNGCLYLGEVLILIFIRIYKNLFPLNPTSCTCRPYSFTFSDFLPLSLLFFNLISDDYVNNLTGMNNSGRNKPTVLGKV